MNDLKSLFRGRSNSLRSIFYQAPSLRCSAALLALLLIGPAVARAQSDDFNDGNDVGWTHIDPLAGVGVGGTGTWILTNGGYRIQASASANPAAAGPGRAGAYLNGSAYGKFYLTFDLVDWDNSLDQIYGVLARVSNVGPGTLNGYAFTYATRTGRSGLGELELLRITNERGSDLSGATALISLNPALDYRFVFTGVGNSFTGRVYSITNFATPLATITGTDPTYASGLVGLFTYDNSPSGANRADVTFDNFYAGTNAPPPRLSVEVDPFGYLTVSWRVPAERFVLESNPILSSQGWYDETDSVFSSGDRFIFHADALEGNKFYRLRYQ